MVLEANWEDKKFTTIKMPSRPGASTSSLSLADTEICKELMIIVIDDTLLSFHNSYIYNYS